MEPLVEFAVLSILDRDTPRRTCDKTLVIKLSARSNVATTAIRILVV